MPSSGAEQLVQRFADLRVLVVGDAMLDRYLQGRTRGICQEGPVPVVRLDACAEVPGGAANTAANVAALGSQVTLLSVAGDDADASALRAVLDRYEVNAALVTQRGRRTITKHRLTAADQLLARFDEGAPQRATPDVTHALIHRLAAGFVASDAVVVADYGYGTCGLEIIMTLERLQARAPRVLIVDARDLTRFRTVGATAMKPNYREAIALLGRPPADGEDRASIVEQHAEALLDAAGAGTVVVTLDADGAIVLERGRAVHRLATRPVPARRAAGAGDTFTAALALALASGADAVTAAEVASAAAAVAVAKPLTATCHAEELQLGLAGAYKRLDGPEELAVRVQAHRRQHRRIVFTNGCFDLLHRGHVTYLNRAKLLGDVLVVAVNSDDSVRRLKGPGRPITPLEDRLQVLSALGCVDHVVPFAEDSPRALLRAARPDIYCKGGDYTEAMLPETDLVAELGIRLEFLSYVEDRSTTRIIDLIRGRTPAS